MVSKNKEKMEVRKQAKGGGAMFVYRELRKEILSLELEPGQPLDENVSCKSIRNVPFTYQRSACAAFCRWAG